MNPCRFLLIAVLRGYQWTISPLLGVLTGTPSACRFQPTCSEYAVESLRLHGVRRGMPLTLHRLCRCHPWGGSGLDLVPERLQN